MPVGGQLCSQVMTRRRMSDTLDAELEVQRTIKRAELPAFLCLCRRIFVLPRLMLATKESLTGCEEEK